MAEFRRRVGYCPNGAPPASLQDRHDGGDAFAPGAYYSSVVLITTVSIGMFSCSLLARPGSNYGYRTELLVVPVLWNVHTSQCSVALLLCVS